MTACSWDLLSLRAVQQAASTSYADLHLTQTSRSSSQAHKSWGAHAREAAAARQQPAGTAQLCRHSIVSCQRPWRHAKPLKRPPCVTAGLAAAAVEGAAASARLARAGPGHSESASAHMKHVGPAMSHAWKQISKQPMHLGPAENWRAPEQRALRPQPAGRPGRPPRAAAGQGPAEQWPAQASCRGPAPAGRGHGACLTSSSEEELAGRPSRAALAGARAEAAVGRCSSGILTGRPLAAALKSCRGGDLYNAGSAALLAAPDENRLGLSAPMRTCTAATPPRQAQRCAQSASSP